MQTVIATFDELDTARAAIASLLALGICPTRIELQTAATVISSAARVPGLAAGDARGDLRVEALHYFSTLFDNDPAHAARIHAEAVSRGCSVVVVTAANAEEARAAGTVMTEHGAIDLKDRACVWMAHGWDERVPQADREQSDRPAMRVLRMAIRLGYRRVHDWAQQVHKRSDDAIAEAAARAPRGSVLFALVRNPRPDGSSTAPR